VESDPIGLSGGLNTYGYAAQDPLSLIDPEGLAERGGGRTSVGGNDPLIPKEINKTSTPQQVKDAIKKVQDAIKRTPGINPARKRALEAWMKVAKRGFTKVIACPPLLEDLARETMRQSCAEGNMGFCSMYEDWFPSDYMRDFGL
jgi:hypothetical protein